MSVEQLLRVTGKALEPYIRDRVLREAVPL